MSSVKKNIIKGTLILTIAGVLTRILGFYNRIFLSNTIGAKELGIFQLIFPIYLVIYSFCSQGIQTALTKMVAEEYTKNNYKNTKKLLYYSIKITFILSLTSAVLLYFFSDWISIHILRASACGNCLKILSIAVPFVSVEGAFIGFFFGINNSKVSAITQLLEQIVRVSIIYILAITLFKINKNAEIAVWGMVTGEIASFSTTLFFFLKDKNKYLPVQKQVSPYNTALKKKLISLSIPVTINRLSITLLSSIEALLIPSMLFLYYKNNNRALSLYGILFGMAIPFILFPSTITNSLALMLLPAISSAYASNNRKLIEDIVEKCIHYCTIIGILSTILFLLFGKSIGTLIFNNAEAGLYITMFAWLCPFIYIASTINSVLNGLGQMKNTLFHNLISIGIRIGFIIIAVPKLGIVGFMWGMLASYFVLVLLHLLNLKKLSNVYFDSTKSILIPAIMGIMSSMLSYLIYTVLFERINLHPIIELLITILNTCIIYTSSLILLKIIKIRELLN